MASKKTWWIAGGAIGCLVIVVVIILIGGVGFLAMQDDEGTTDDEIETIETDDNASADVGPTLTWTNDLSRLSGDKAANFVPFTFDYPAHWRVVEDGTQPDSDSPNFVKVERATDDQITIENFAVGWYSGAGAADVMTMLEPQFAGSFPNYQKVADQTATVDGITSSGFLFQARIDTANGPVAFYGRALAVPVSPTNGILIIMFASELAQGVQGPEDVGEEGQMTVILESFDIQQ
jgi:hypothetical protein